ncbi:efflux RND transporter permease subunit [Pontiellaceae bacterium B12219]|nr:efflux RND transporter permease subunit [Pontiellaceae bacterium B12219]
MSIDLEQKRGPIAWMANNIVAANILMIVLLGGGIFSATKIKQEFLPQAELDVVSVSVPYPGASPDEVEQGILLAIEESVRGIDGVKKVTSTASEGSGSVQVEVIEGYDVNIITDEIRNEVDRIRTFPLDAEEPVISAASVKRSVMDVIVSADVSETVLRELTEQTRDKLLQSGGVTQLELSNIRSYEIAIEIPQAKLRELNLSLQDVSDIISRSSVELPGGGMKTTSGEILVRVKDRRDLGREFASIPIVTATDGTRVLLEDIAEIRDSFDESDKFTFFNGKPAMTMTVYRVGKETPLSVEKAVLDVLEELEATMPDGVDFTLWNNRADSFRGRMGLLLKNGAMGLVLVFVLLGLFLEMRLAFWVMLGIPISFLGTFLFMGPMDVSLNMITMFAFLIALGIVVDDAIVVGENIYHKHQEGMPFLQAAIAGARQIAVPVTFSILTNIVAFMPLYFVPGVMGKFFRNIPLIVCTTFLISLVEALYILPAHLAHQKDLKNPHMLHRIQQRFSQKFTHFVRDIYGPFLDRVLNFRYITVSIGMVVLIVTIGYIKSGRMGFELFPSVESDIAMSSFTLPYGAPVENTRMVHDRVLAAGNKVIAEIEKEYGKPIVKGVISNIGAGGRGGPSGGHVASISYELLDADSRPVSTQVFADRWREATGPISGLKNIRFRADSGGPGGGSDALTVDLSHRDMNVLEVASKELAAALSAYPMVLDIDDGFTPGKPQIDFSINAEGRSLGLTSTEIARQVRNSYYGSEAIRQQRGRNEIKVKVRLPEAERDTEFSLEEMIVRTPAGTEVPLREVVNVERGRAYTSITRNNGRRVVTVSSDVKPRDQVPQMLAVLTGEILPDLMQRHSGLSYSFEGRQADQRESVGGLITGLFLALIMIYVLLAIPFKSYWQPMIIMVSIPFGVVGAVVGHLMLGYTLSLMSLFGVVALSGVVVNDSLVFIDFANQKRREGMNMHDAVLSSGIQRFRPIILTTLTTFFGLMPMILETSRQARFLIPMAISLGFGILFATGITLILIPSLIMILEDIGRLFKGQK